MRERALVHITGPAGAGKTTLIEHLLRTNRSRLIAAVRGKADDQAQDHSVSFDDSDGDPARYALAGAYLSATYGFPPGGADTDTFYESRLMLDVQEAVLIEGDWPLHTPPDLTVFVAPPLPEGQPLIERTTRPRRVDFDGTRAGFQSLLARLDPHAARVVAAQLGALFDSASDDSASEAETEACWGLTHPYAGLERAELVVLSVGTDDERERAETTAAEIARIREDDAIFTDLRAPFMTRRPVTVAIADLSDAKDAGLKKALTRLRRAVARGAR